MTQQQDPARPHGQATGVLVWVGLAASDPAVAVAFYTAAFGWEAVGEADHTILRRAGADVALVYPQTPQARAAGVTPHWTPFFSVADTDVALGRAVRSGGMALRGPFDVPGGRLAAIQDPAGAIFSIWAPRGPDWSAPSVRGGWWMDLKTPDVKAAQAFYGDLLDWTYDQRLEGPKGIRGPAGPIGRMSRADAAAAWLPSLAVADVEEARQCAKAAGALHVGVAEEDATGRRAALIDPQGAALSLLEPS